MSREFRNLGEMALFAATRAVAVHTALGSGLERALKKIERTAKSEFGAYQPGVGGFPEWPDLAEATKADRVAQGYPEDEPLLREGDLRDSIDHEADRDAMDGVVGSTSDIMPYYEFGTSRMPARPVLGPAAIRNEDAIKKLVGAAAVSGLVGSDRIHSALGYDFETGD